MENKNKSVLTIILTILAVIVVIGIILMVTASMVTGIIIAVLAVILLISVAVNYNRIIKYKNKVSESLALIDIHLKLRFDLIPNLVNTVKGYTKHEAEVFEEIARLRGQAVETENEEEKIELANQIVPKLKQIVFLAEDYPELKAQSLYKSLMSDLADIEDRLVASRRIYDSNVNEYNTLIQTFPNNIYAMIFGCKAEKLFKIDTGESIVTNINF